MMRPKSQICDIIVDIKVLIFFLLNGRSSNVFLHGFEILLMFCMIWTLTRKNLRGSTGNLSLVSFQIKNVIQY